MIKIKSKYDFRKKKCLLSIVVLFVVLGTLINSNLNKLIVVVNKKINKKKTLIYKACDNDTPRIK